MSKQLGEFLQEQQEPFILEVYLLEKGCSTRRFSSEYSSCNVGSLLKRSVSSGLKGNTTFVPCCSRFLTGLVSKLLTVADGRHKLNDSGTRDQSSFCGSCSSKEEAVDDDEFSSASSATIFNSCSEGDVDDAHCLQICADERQLGPVSVLEDAEVNDASPYRKKNDDGNRRRQFQFSALACAYRREKPFCRPDASSQYSRNKKAVQETKQLLFDCVREVVDQRIKKDSPDQPSPQILGPDKLWEIICDDISMWSKEPINEANTSHLVHSDWLSSAQEWSIFEQEKEELDMHIADAILEDIRNEIITDMRSNSSSISVNILKGCSWNHIW